MFDLARALFLSDQPEESRKILHKALALDPCLHRCVALLGHIHYQMGQWDEAVEKYRKAILLGADAETLDPLIESARMKGGPQ